MTTAALHLARRAWLLAPAAALAIGPQALGQAGQGSPSDPPPAGSGSAEPQPALRPAPALAPAVTVRDLRRVAPSIADVGPLAVSPFMPEGNLRQPNDFADLFQIPEDADSPYAGWFVRVRGGLMAAFPRGQYNRVRGNALPIVPTNTRYFLGSVPGMLADRRARPGSGVESRIETRLPSGVPNPGGQPAGANPSVASQPTAASPAGPAAPAAATEDQTSQQLASRVERLMLDERYRALRLDELLEAAGRATGN